MKDLDYTYAVAYIRAKESTLLTDAIIDQLINCQDEKQCLDILSEKGWGISDIEGNAAEILKCEEQKTWNVIRSVAPDLAVFDVLFYSKLYHNLKAAIKEVCTGVSGGNIYYNDCAIAGKEMLQIVENKEFGKLPGQMAVAAREAFETLLHTKDGQLCDIMIDKAALDAIYKAGKNAKDDIIKNYAELTVAIADIKIAVRCQKTGKSLEFMKQAMAECDSVSIDQLSKSALAGADAIREYLLGTTYAEGAQALEESPSAFERWCDNRMMQTIRPQKYKAFSVGPLVAYLLARENEIKTVRIILTGKKNGFPEEAIRERVREMYV
ncbi:MAG: V-type ATPase subunit [Schaedlerella sp.]|nr:V-type ATPase subunit [Schaedlerella sp.]